MESKKEPSSSSSTFTADLFGSKESPPSSSSGIFASIFPYPGKVVGRKSGQQSSPNQGGNTKQGANKDRKSIFEEERGGPCNLSSSLYYGGQDNYSQSQPPSGMLKKGGRDDGDDPNSNSASRGNWWQGSLYY